MASLFDLTTSSGFRKKLLVRNLTPYAKSPNRPSQPIDTEYVQSDISVQDSPDQLIDVPSFANNLFPLNQYGAEGGYKQVPDPNALLNSKSNEGEYGYQDANIVDQSLVEQKKWKPLNVYSNNSQSQLDAAEFINSLDTPITYSNTSNNQPYPATFVPSTYFPASILLSRDPQGNNGLLSQDSFIQRLGAETLRREFEERIATQIRQDTIGRANILNVRGGTDLLNIVSGVVPVLEPNYTITVPINPVLAATNFALRLAGSVIPVSPIPGSYFDPSINPGNPTTLQQIGNAFRRSAVGSFVNKLLGGTQTGSQIMFNNMGAGQKSRLFKNIDYNKFKPNFPRSIFDRVAGVLRGDVVDNSNYYVGSITSEPSRVFSPSGSLPNDAFGNEIQSPVYGPSEMAQLYEGPSREIKLGANGPTYSNGGGIEGGMTWVSPKYKGNAGKKVGIGGQITNEDQDFKPSSYNSTESTNITFKQGSILDETQRLIDSQPQGGKRLQHVGNAIDQVSKVFNDGYKELTKGSRVYRYVGAIGQEVGTEYCRVFAKDTPYLQYNDLQKVDGVTVNGRRFSDSVLDNTYNLNIVPNKQEGGQSSTNLIGGMNNGYAKKYMFSIENLAWRTSSTPGYSVSDLPVCERGPNGGRVMWFPPYGLTFNESSTPNWNQSDFLGRPEPVYTYKNTSRGGTLTWKIVVDHPSVLNLIVNKVLANETNRTRVDSILESFFAGCRKYDIYELAKKYYTVNPNDLLQLQEAISSKDLTTEQIVYSKKTIQSGNQTPNGQSTNLVESGGISKNLKEFEQVGFYFANDYPKKGNVTDYQNQYTIYKGEVPTYEKESTWDSTKQFFDEVVDGNYSVLQELAIQVGNQLKTNTNGNITITIDSSCSAPATIEYNKELSKRRFQSAYDYFVKNPNTSGYVRDKRLLIISGNTFGEQTNSQSISFKKVDGKYSINSKVIGKTINCTDKDGKTKGGDTTSVAKGNYNTNAMACRRAIISKIEDKTSAPPSTPQPKPIEVLVGNKVTETKKIEEVSREWKPRDNITKRVLRSLLSECDYFETIKAETPMVFDNLKDKLKFFHPGFHSITPEGLNSRLTFLQQCMRPGDTIPTIAQVGQTQELKYNNATNTAFGAPPVLVLRVGDFYNTKIIPTGLQIAYEDLDINPEGIGVQPMIANITLNFNFVGGSGLKESVDKLQNALTFNYYANTEMYDDRADVTAQEEYLKVLDKEFLAMATPPSAPTINQASPNNGQNNNATIGTIVSNEVTSTGETGLMSYSTFVDGLVKQTQTYYQNVVNKTKEITNQYNNAVRQQWMFERNYNTGNLNVAPSEFELFGKPSNLETRINKIFEQFQLDIQSGDEFFIRFLSNPSLEFTNRTIKTVKDNYFNYVKNKRSSFQNAMTKTTQDFVNSEQTYIQQLSRINTILYQADDNILTDGLQSSNGNVKIYNLTGTTEIDSSSQGVTTTTQELIEDIIKIQSDMTEFNKIIQLEQSFKYPGDSNEYKGILTFPMINGRYTEFEYTIVFEPFSKSPSFGPANISFRRSYMINSDDVLDNKKYESFKNALIGNLLTNKDIAPKLDAAFDNYWLINTKPVFEEENKLTRAFIDNMEKERLKNFLIYTPFPTKKRTFNFSTEPASSDLTKKTQENMVKSLAASTNSSTNIRTWNDDVNGNFAGYNSTNGYISKVKLN